MYHKKHSKPNILRGALSSRNLVFYCILGTSFQTKSCAFALLADWWCELCLLDIMPSALLVITWMASNFSGMRNKTEGDVAVPRIILILMNTVTMKVLPIKDAKQQVIIWPTSSIMEQSDAARWRKVILSYLIHTWIRNHLQSNVTH